MQATQHTAGILADAAAGLSQQLQEQLRWMAEAVAPHEASLGRRFLRRLTELGYDRDQRDSLVAITPGAAAQLLIAGEPLAKFLETVEYRGRRLAKLGLTPASVVSGLAEYEKLLAKVVDPQYPGEAANLAWVRSQLQFLVILTLNNAFYQVREAESHAFYELFRVEVESHTWEEMLPGFLSVLRQYTGADDARLFLLSEDGKQWTPPHQPSQAPLAAPPRVRAALAKPRLVQGGAESTILILEPGWRTRFTHVWSVPMHSENLLRGVLQFAFAGRYEWLPRELELLSAAAERCWRAAEKAKLLENLAIREEQIRRLAHHMVEVEESERRRISRELHDEAGQSLLCVRLQMEMLEQEIPESAGAWRGRLKEVRQMTEHTIVEIRRLIAALSPAILEQMGLAAALRQLIGRFRRIHSADVRLRLPRRLDVSKMVEIILYRLVQEVFNNIAKHSLASNVNLSVDSADGCLRMHIEDNGVGFQVQEAFSRRDCFGLSGLRERVALLGGTLVVKSLPKEKTADSAGNVGPSRQVVGKSAGQIGVDRHGTSIQIELPALTVNAPRTGPPDVDEPPPPVKARERAGQNVRTSSR